VSIRQHLLDLADTLNERQQRLLDQVVIQDRADAAVL
jgi:hypothetical protein